MSFLHELPIAKELFQSIGQDLSLDPYFVEKDYWIMHCLYGLKQQGINFELKGGTSLSKGFGIIERFSEDLDMKIIPQDHDVKIGPNHTKTLHINSREIFFNHITSFLSIPGMSFKRAYEFDDKKLYNAGIRGNYDSLFQVSPILKNGIILELGFANTAPNIPCNITSWAYEKAINYNIKCIDNRAKEVKCFCPEYTLVEKLEAISRKYAIQQQKGSIPVNFIRHYYDVYKLLQQPNIQEFIKSDKYTDYRDKCFKRKNVTLKHDPAFSINDQATRKIFNQEFERKLGLYYGKDINFNQILLEICSHLEYL